MIPPSNYLNVVKQQIQREGVTVTYSSTTQGVYNPETSTVTNSTSQTVLKAFPAVCTFSEQQNPNLVGVASKAFLMTSTDLLSKPKPNDEILQGTDKYTVKIVKEHWGSGVLCMYRVLCVEG